MPADKTGRSIFFNCSRPGSRNDLKFFSLCPCLYWAPATKVSSRPDENFLSERLYNRPHGTKFYQLKAKMEANKVPSSHFSMEDKSVAVDLNPIENVWSWMKNKLQDSKATNLPALQREITELWTLQMDNIDYLKTLVESMPRRLEAFIENGGNATKY